MCETAGDIIIDYQPKIIKIERKNSAADAVHIIRENLTNVVGKHTGTFNVCHLEAFQLLLLEIPQFISC